MTKPIRKAILHAQFLDREEAAEQFKQESVARWEGYCRTGKSVSHDAAMSWLESWGSENEREAQKCGYGMPVDEDTNNL